MSFMGYPNNMSTGPSIPSGMAGQVVFIGGQPYLAQQHFAPPIQHFTPHLQVFHAPSSGLHCRVPGCTKSHRAHPCYNCHVENSVHFSRHCPKLSSVSSGGGRFCSGCGRSYSFGASFCSGCGARVYT